MLASHITLAIVGLNNFEECNQRREIEIQALHSSSKVDRRSIKGSNETIMYIQRYLTCTLQIYPKCQ